MSKRELSALMNGVREKISKDRGYLPNRLIGWDELSAECGGIPTKNMYRWQDSREGTGMPSYNYCVQMAPLFGDEIFDACGYPRPMPNDPEVKAFLDLYERSKTDPNAAHIVAQATKQAKSYLNSKIVRNISNSEVTPA